LELTAVDLLTHGAEQAVAHQLQRIHRTWPTLQKPNDVRSVTPDDRTPQPAPFLTPGTMTILNPTLGREGRASRRKGAD